jgi:hypothetical protein
VIDRIRMHLDENVDPDVARALRRHGIDVSTTQGVGLRTQSDAAQLALSAKCWRRLIRRGLPGLSNQPKMWFLTPAM